MRFGECRLELRLRDHTFVWERFHIYHSALLGRAGPDLFLKRILT